MRDAYSRQGTAMGEIARRASSKTLFERGRLWIWSWMQWLWFEIVDAVRAIGEWQLSRILLWAAITVVFVYVGIFAAVYVGARYLSTQIPHNPPVNNIVYLDQGWGPSVTSEKRQLYYYEAQGTSFVNMRYRWFVNLEKPDSTERFADPTHMRSMGFIVDNVRTPNNPDQLPVGFTQHFDPIYKEEFLDVTCAACHTGELHVVSKAGEQVAIRIDGGQGMHAFTHLQPGQFGPALLGSLATTALNPWKFDRFAQAVLKEHYKDGKSALYSEFFSSLLVTS